MLKNSTPLAEKNNNISDNKCDRSILVSFFTIFLSRLYYFYDCFKSYISVKWQRFAWLILFVKNSYLKDVVGVIKTYFSMESLPGDREICKQNWVNFKNIPRIKWYNFILHYWTVSFDNNNCHIIITSHCFHLFHLALRAKLKN